MFSRGWEVGGEAWQWRRQLRAWEEELLGECQAFLLTISLQDHVSDRWLWRTDLDDGYTVRDAYQLLTSQDDVTLDAASGLIWHRQVPLKVSICAWRLLRDRLPTKANLVTRGILSTEAHFCVFGCGEVESAQHLFLYCSSLGPLWSLVSSWIGSSSVTAQTLPEHFVQFTDSAAMKFQQAQTDPYDREYTNLRLLNQYSHGTRHQHYICTTLLSVSATYLSAAKAVNAFLSRC
ncbi:uncharacterized protein LOC123896645 [Trifolium pratense]|uniref:uncharacterized protein LOC123896645 n=1 Tax=Trifolium pratense TaxID=57577 RepID=UPI001E6907B9|nr:uncharacterized protein LOC123896645 [Trifolium pratense]